MPRKTYMQEGGTSTKSRNMHALWWRNTHSARHQEVRNERPTSVNCQQLRSAGNALFNRPRTQFIPQTPLINRHPSPAHSGDRYFTMGEEQRCAQDTHDCCSSVQGEARTLERRGTAAWHHWPLHNLSKLKLQNRIIQDSQSWLYLAAVRKIIWTARFFSSLPYTSTNPTPTTRNPGCMGGVSFENGWSHYLQFWVVKYIEEILCKYHQIPIARGISVMLSPYQNPCEYWWLNGMLSFFGITLQSWSYVDCFMCKSPPKFQNSSKFHVFMHGCNMEEFHVGFPMAWTHTFHWFSRFQTAEGNDAMHTPVRLLQNHSKLPHLQNLRPSNLPR